MLEVKIKNFQGPLDLLLKMIEKEEMDITKISLAHIADQYVEHIKASKNLIKPEEIGDFLLVAARLLFLKSKVLLPYLQGEEEEDEDELAQQLKIYKEFLEASQNINKMAQKQRFMFFPREAKPQKRAFQSQEGIFNPPRKLSKEDLRKTFKEIVKGLKKSEFLEEKLEEEQIDYQINIEDKIKFIRQMVSQKIKFDFNHILENSSSKTEIIVSFLAILELSKQRFLIADQEDLFSPIFVNSNHNKDYE